MVGEKVRRGGDSDAGKRGKRLGVMGFHRGLTGLYYQKGNGLAFGEFGLDLLLDWIRFMALVYNKK